MRKAVVLLSGGLDSAATLYLAKKQGFRAYCLIFDYGQRHKREINAAKKIAQSARCQYRVIKINLPWKGSSLLDKKIKISPRYNAIAQKSNNDIPATYVPARNVIFLSFALSYAETIGAQAIFIGAHSQDYSNYPDCRPEFYRAFSRVICLGTKTGIEKNRIQVKTPLINKAKAQIIRLARSLGVPLALTWSCYRGERAPCGRCDSCYFRAKGFKALGLKDPCL
jgi:7-cyano-7-deazaguanine synthase